MMIFYNDFYYKNHIFLQVIPNMKDQLFLFLLSLLLNNHINLNQLLDIQHLIES